MASIFRFFRRQCAVKEAPRPVELLDGSGGHGSRAAFHARFATSDGADWLALGASVVGNAKKASGRRCEDYCHFTNLAPGVAILILADGAGSCSASAKGAEFVARFGTATAIRATLSRAAGRRKCAISDLLQRSSEADWTSWARGAVAAVRENLLELSKRNRVELEALSSTLVACIVTANRLFVVHVGDGRGSFKTENGDWHPLFEPVLGENAGETIFVASPFASTEEFEQFIHCHVYDEQADEICLMSDGCEAPSFLTSVYRPEDGRYHRSNIPFSGFLGAIRPFVMAFPDDPREALNRWIAFVKEGSPKLAAETDDKTLVYALRNPYPVLP